MARYRKTVTSTAENTDRLPDWASAGVALLLDLERRGMLAEVAERLQIRREGGFSGIDVFVFLAYYFASKLPEGLKPFWYRARAHREKLGAVAGRKCLPSSTAMSRALEAVELELLRPQVAWLLIEATGIDEVLRHPAVQHYDALGRGWHVFDYDPTNTVLRQRALPAGEELPEARRRAEGLAAPGYFGRKRGEVKLRRATLQHAGSGTWLHAMLNAGNGDCRAELPEALKVVVDLCAKLDHPLERALFRADGEYGGVPQLSAFIEAGVPFVTRLTRPALLDRPELRRRLVEAQWELVPDSKSGPSRSATDIGIVTLQPGTHTRQDDGSDYKPVGVRVVVSRFPREGEPSRGKVIAGWQYELFATSLDPDPWPAAEVVASYFGRTGQENRFAQEDRELGLDRIFSYHLPGQELATTIGLMVWNARIALGFELETPPFETPEQAERLARPDPRPVPLETREVVELDEENDGAADIEKPERPAPAEPVGDSSLEEAEASLATLLGELDWDRMLAGKDGWYWDAEAGQLACSHGRGLPLTCVDDRPGWPGRARLHFRTRRGGCTACRLLGSCFSTIDPVPTKLASFTLEDEKVHAIQAYLPGVQSLRRQHASVETKKASRGRRRRLAVEAPILLPPRDSSSDGGLSCLPSLFLPAAARHVFDDLVQDLASYITVTLPSAPIPHPALLARAAADRQHRRLTWTQHHERYALPDGADIDITLAGGGRLVALLRGAAARAANAANG